MTLYGIPKTATIGATATWPTTVSGYNSTTHDLLWLFGTTEITAAAQGAAWQTSTDWEGQVLGAMLWTLSVKNKATLAITEIATGSIFLETPEYNTLRLQHEAAEAAILKILQGGGNQSISIKGRSTSKYGLEQLKAISKQCQADMNRLLNGNQSRQVLVRF